MAYQASQSSGSKAWDTTAEVSTKTAGPSVRVQPWYRSLSLGVSFQVAPVLGPIFVVETQGCANLNLQKKVAGWWLFSLFVKNTWNMIWQCAFKSDHLQNCRELARFFLSWPCALSPPCKGSQLKLISGTKPWFYSKWQNQALTLFHLINQNRCRLAITFSTVFTAVWLFTWSFERDTVCALYPV